jgi:predicted DNA-binding protein
MADEIARKANARKGGIARAAALSPEQRSAIARHANQARWHTEQRSRPVAFRIPCDLYDRLMHHAERDGMSASEALRSAVDLYVDTWDNNEAWDAQWEARNRARESSQNPGAQHLGEK